MTTDPAAVLRALHVPGKPLILPNAWDAASAVAVQEAGFPAVATGSAAVAQVLGYEDHEVTPAAEMLAAVARVVRVVDVPVTADMERGYGLEPAELVERLSPQERWDATWRTPTPARASSSRPGVRPTSWPRYGPRPGRRW